MSKFRVDSSSSPPSALEPGAWVGPYCLERYLGSGGVGAVWVARPHADARKLVALKIFHRALALLPHARTRLTREADACNRIAHSTVVPVSVEKVGDELFLVMDLLEGETLRARLARERKLPFDVAARLLCYVSSGVAAAHDAGVVHRDLKPENIFIESGLDPGAVKLLDFGLAKLLDDEPGGRVLSTHRSAARTLAYMAPEQANGALVDERADVWALGVVLYEALAGFRPVVGKNAAELLERLLYAVITPIAVVCPNVAEPVADLLGRMLSRSPGRRPTALEVQEALVQETGVDSTRIRRAE